MTAKQVPLWFGFLQAGSKGSPVVLDPSLDTCRPSTVYLFNLKKGRILEYRRDIVESKLRELTADEVDVQPALEEAFAQTRPTFKPRTVPRPVSTTPPKKKRLDDEIAEFDLDDADIPDLDGDDDEDLGDGDDDHDA